MTGKTVLVIGANRGIGFCIVQALSQRLPSSHLLLGCRSVENGEEAIKKLRALGAKSEMNVVQIDITDNDSIQAAERDVRSKYGKLDILVNNAAIAEIIKDLSSLRNSYNRIFNMNITPVAYTMMVFLPLIRETSSDPRVISISSRRGSLKISASGTSPPTQAISYGVSKAALNLLMVEFSRVDENKNVVFHSACPGHCATAFNGYRGARDPLDGAGIIVELIACEREEYPSGFWKKDSEDKKPMAVPW
ncbi:MAG: hypothetical protein M1834_006699 [Cirrosporium novae-zelandiae]|nr:MAG: hypothetical protein M1834_006699 [Cirrosporium novae-zelandiae]